MAKKKIKKKKRNYPADKERGSSRGRGAGPRDKESGTWVLSHTFGRFNGVDADRGTGSVGGGFYVKSIHATPKGGAWEALNERTNERASETTLTLHRAPHTHTHSQAQNQVPAGKKSDGQSETKSGGLQKWERTSGVHRK